MLMKLFHQTCGCDKTPFLTSCNGTHLPWNVPNHIEAFTFTEFACFFQSDFLCFDLRSCDSIIITWVSALSLWLIVLPCFFDIFCRFGSCLCSRCERRDSALTAIPPEKESAAAHIWFLGLIAETDARLALTPRRGLTGCAGRGRISWGGVVSRREDVDRSVSHRPS